MPEPKHDPGSVTTALRGFKMRHRANRTALLNSVHPSTPIKAIMVKASPTVLSFPRTSALLSFRDLMTLGAFQVISS